MPSGSSLNVISSEQVIFGGSSTTMSSKEELKQKEDKEPEDGFDEYFDPPLDKYLECCVCLMGLRHPIQTMCGHRFCKSCILRSIRHNGHRCPVDNEHLDESKMYPDTNARLAVLASPVRCRAGGAKRKRPCPWKGPLTDLRAHLEECALVDVDCPKGCGKRSTREDIARHSKVECPNRTMPCVYCCEQVLWNLEEEHRGSCPKQPVTCPNCGQEDLAKDALDQHLKTECPMYEVHCPFEELGCTFRALRRKMAEHVRDECPDHSVRLLEAFRDDRQRHETSATRAPTLTETLTQLRPLPSSSSSRSPDDVGVFEVLLSGFRREIEDLHKKVHDMERKLEQERMSSHALTYQVNCGELKSRDIIGRLCNGHFIWKIDNYAQCRQDAINGVMTALHSDALYTHLNGYKMCMRINLNGVDSGLGKHIALFVHMMQGDYDSILEWPFTGRIVLSILDQSDADHRHHLSESLIAKPNLLAFKRPTAPRNYKGYGYVEFAPIEQMREGTYVKNNTMLVKIQVFRDQLASPSSH